MKELEQVLKKTFPEIDEFDIEYHTKKFMEFCEEDGIFFNVVYNSKEKHKIQIYIDLKLDNVSKLKKQLTYDEAVRLTNEFSKRTIHETLLGMENCKPLTKKYNSVNLTIRNWIRLRKTNDNGEETKPKVKYIPDEPKKKYVPPKDGDREEGFKQVGKILRNWDKIVKPKITEKSQRE